MKRPKGSSRTQWTDNVREWSGCSLAQGLQCLETETSGAPFLFNPLEDEVE